MPFIINNHPSFSVKASVLILTYNYTGTFRYDSMQSVSKSLILPVLDAAHPLITERNSSMDVESSVLIVRSKAAVATASRFRAVSLYLGMLIGFFTQFATLGAKYVLDAKADRDETLTAVDKFLLILLWSVATSAIALVGFVVLRLRFEATYDGEDMEGDFDAVECSYVNGVLFGIGAGWVATSIVLRATTSAPASLFVMSLAILLCWVLVNFAASSGKPSAKVCCPLTV
jgi:hypothetical protein